MVREYRVRIYNHYVSARQETLAPADVEGLSTRAPYLRRLVRQHFPEDKDATVLDLGCGHGALIHFAREAGYRNVCGVDSSPEQVAAARRLGIEGVEEGNLLLLLRAQSDASLDCVIAFDVIEHFSKDELIGFVDEVFRVLKPGGCWIIHVPNAESPFGNRIRHGDFTHELAFTRQSLAQVLLSSGFSQVRCFEDRPVSHGVKSAVRALLWAVFRLGLLFYIAVETGVVDRRAIFSQNLLAVTFKSQ
jgi:cyclopropane fatty-acyl-phospholipid synthase-like methyltransferase